VASRLISSSGPNKTRPAVGCPRLWRAAGTGTCSIPTRARF